MQLFHNLLQHDVTENSIRKVRPQILRMITGFWFPLSDVISFLLHNARDSPSDMTQKTKLNLAVSLIFSAFDDTGCLVSPPRWMVYLPV